MIYFLAVIIALLPTYQIRFHIGQLPTTLLELLVVVFLFITLLRINRAKLKKIKNLGKVNWAIGLFVLAGVISTIISPEFTKALGQLKAFIIEPALVFYAVILTIKNDQQLKKVLQFLFWSAVVISVFGVFQYYSFIHLPLRFWGNGPELERITSFFDYPNALSLFLAPIIGFFTTLWVYKYPLFKSRFIWAAGILVMGIALLLTFSRGAWLGLAVGLFVVLLKKYGTKKVIIPSLVLVLLLLLVPSVRQRIGLGLSDPSSEAHFGLMQAGIAQISHNLVLGNGLAGFAHLNLGVEYPHNVFLNFWAEMGIFGLAAFVWIVYLCFQRYKKPASSAGRDSQPILLAASIYILILLIHGLLDVPYFKNDLSILFWFVIAMFYL